MIAVTLKFTNSVQNHQSHLNNTQEQSHSLVIVLLSGLTKQPSSESTLLKDTRPALSISVHISLCHLNNVRTLLPA